MDGEVKEEFDFKVQPNPKAEITQEALEVAGVTKEQILSYPPMGTIFPQFIAMLDKYVDRFNKKDKFFLAGYNNASFDNQFLRAWFLQNGDKYFGSWFWSNSIDVMVLATPYLAAKRTEMENFKQGLQAFAQVVRKRPKHGGEKTTMIIGYRLISEFDPPPLTQPHGLGQCGR